MSDNSLPGIEERRRAWTAACKSVYRTPHTRRLETKNTGVAESNNFIVGSSVPDPDPDWIRIQGVFWIRIRSRNPDPGA